MNINLKERLIRHIKDRYKDNLKIEEDDKVDLDEKANKIYDPTLYEYKKDIYDAIKNKINNSIKNSKILNDD
ncbi:MAG TPA: hypothetical protein PK771_15965, partial [Spirochaetota bacterium]|nr:hypothetical protein [Spirochaetota bacterium]